MIYLTINKSSFEIFTGFDAHLIGFLPVTLAWSACAP